MPHKIANEAGRETSIFFAALGTSLFMNYLLKSTTSVKLEDCAQYYEGVTARAALAEDCAIRNARKKISGKKTISTQKAIGVSMLSLVIVAIPMTGLFMLWDYAINKDNPKWNVNTHVGLAVAYGFIMAIANMIIMQAGKASTTGEVILYSLLFAFVAAGSSALFNEF